MKTVLVFFSYRSHKTGYIEMLFERLSKAAKAHELKLVRGSLHDLHITITRNKLSVVESLTGESLGDFDAVYFELWYKAPEQALAAARYLENQQVPFFSRELLTTMPLSKVGEMAVMADSNIPLPDTFISSRREIKRVFKRQGAPLIFPLIAKDAYGYGGKNNYLVSSYDELAGILDANRAIKFVLQEFIPNDCDYRCLVMDGKIVLVLQRTRNPQSGTHLNNTSAGAEGKMVPVAVLSEESQQAVLAAAKALGREQFCGVDLMTHKHTGKPFILEVNQTPQIEIGAETDAKMRALLAYVSGLAEKGIANA